MAGISLVAKGCPEYPAPVFVNGKPIGWTRDATAAAATLRTVRRGGEQTLQLSGRDRKRVMTTFNQTSILEDGEAGELQIWTDAGRLVRPLFTVDTCSQRVSAEIGQRPIKELLMKGDMEFVEMAEQMNACVVAVSRIDLWRVRLLRELCNGNVSPLNIMQTATAATESGTLPDGRVLSSDIVRAIQTHILESTATLDTPLASGYTHAEIHPTFMFGVLANLIPFANHNMQVCVLL